MKNPNPWVVVTDPGTDQEDILADFRTATQARQFMRAHPDTDLMKRLDDGSLTTEF